jgi:hypothetical protein
LLASCIAHPPFAYASPSDSIWFPGIYDIADYDDVIEILVDTTVIPKSPAAQVGPVLSFSRLFLDLSASVPLDASLPYLHLRSPPTI